MSSPAPTLNYVPLVLIQCYPTEHATNNTYIMYLYMMNSLADSNFRNISHWCLWRPWHQIHLGSNSAAKWPSRLDCQPASNLIASLKLQYRPSVASQTSPLDPLTHSSQILNWEKDRLISVLKIFIKIRFVFISWVMTDQASNSILAFFATLSILPPQSPALPWPTDLHSRWPEHLH